MECKDSHKVCNDRLKECSNLLQESNDSLALLHAKIDKLLVGK